MDRDFSIELSVPDGIRCLAPLLERAPVDLEIGHEDGVESEVLIQASVSRVAAFFCKGSEGAVQTYGVCVHEAYEGNPQDLLRQFSLLFREANLTHRIMRVEYEYGEDEELLAYHAQA